MDIRKTGYKKKITKKQELYNKNYGTPKKSGLPTQTKSEFGKLEDNPVIHFYLKALGGEFYTSVGGNYQPGNPLYDKHNGEYHIHLNGEICAGKHQIKVMNPYNILTPIDNPNFINERRKIRTGNKRRKPLAKGRYGYPPQPTTGNLPNRNTRVLKKKAKK